VEYVETYGYFTPGSAGSLTGKMGMRPVRVGFRWVHQAAHILSNQDQREALTVQRRLGGLLGAMTRHQAAAGTLAPAPIQR